MLKKSKYLYLFSCNDGWYAVQTKTKKIYKLEKNVYDAFANDDIEFLISHVNRDEFTLAELLIDTSRDELSELEKQCIDNDFDEEWNSLHIIPSIACNMGCSYCFVLQDVPSDKVIKSISEKELYAMIDLFVEDNPSKKKAMTFYGGEPFVNKDIVYKAVEYANDKYNKQFQYKIVTNGTLITKEIADFLYINEFDVNLSLDGNREAHDRFRKYKNGKSTYDDVIRGYNLLKQAGNSIKILVTVGDFNIDYIEECVMSLIELNPTSIALNLPKQLQTKDNSIEFQDNYDYICEKYFKCLELCYKHNIPEAHFADIIYGFLSEDIHYRPCSGCGKQIALSPYGTIGPCQAYVSTGKYFVETKNIRDKQELRNTPEFAMWKDITMYRSSKCRECYLLPICAGDCPFDWENREGNFDNPPEGYCFTRKKMFDYLLERIVSRKNILFKKGRKGEN